MWIVPYCVLVLLNIADFTSTTMLINREGFSQEANPILYHWMVLANSVYPMAIAKAIPVVALGILLVYSNRKLSHREKLIRNVLWGLNLGFLSVVIMGILMLQDVHIS